MRHRKLKSCTGRFALAAAMVVGTLALAACTSQPSQAQSDSSAPMHTEANPNHALEVAFYGERLGPDDDPASVLLVERMVVRDGTSGESAPFVPVDLDSLQNSFGFYTQVWSPDGEWLALPAGRFEGFVVYKAEALLPAVRENRPASTARVAVTSGATTALWHEFAGWRAPNTLLFSAGLSGDLVAFELDVVTGEIRTTQTDPAAFSAVSPDGALTPVLGPQ